LNQDNLLFALMQKVTKKSRANAMLRRFAGPRTTVTLYLLFDTFYSSLSHYEVHHLVFLKIKNEMAENR